MVSEVTAKNANIDFIKKGHSSIFRIAQRLLFMITRFRREGKTAFGARVREAQDLLNRFTHEWKWYVEMEENIILSFLQVHVPRLESDIPFFRLEHEELKDRVQKIVDILEALAREEHASNRTQLILKVQDLTTYWFCQLKQHIKSEEQVISTVMIRELKPNERAKIARLLQDQLSERSG
jgi:hemerythrin-like domain-containing protein